LDKLFSPRGIVIIGVSPRPGNLDQGVLLNRHAHGYTGQVYLVGRGGEAYAGLQERAPGTVVQAFLA
jgi:acyl-CoA synthetase (NDP forming)